MRNEEGRSGLAGLNWLPPNLLTRPIRIESRLLIIAKGAILRWCRPSLPSTKMAHIHIDFAFKSDVEKHLSFWSLNENASELGPFTPIILRGLSGVLRLYPS